MGDISADERKQRITKEKKTLTHDTHNSGRDNFFT